MSKIQLAYLNRLNEDAISLHEGGKAQQPGTPIYNKELTATQAQIVLSNQ